MENTRIIYLPERFRYSTRTLHELGASMRCILWMVAKTVRLDES
jgi:hypothetical protein